MISQGLFNATESYFLIRGGVAVCESTCYNEPIVVYGPGSMILMYQALYDHPLHVDYLAIAGDSLIIKDYTVCYDARAREYF